MPPRAARCAALVGSGTRGQRGKLCAWPNKARAGAPRPRPRKPPPLTPRSTTPALGRDNHLPHRNHVRRPRHPLANGRHRTPADTTTGPHSRPHQPDKLPLWCRGCSRSATPRHRHATAAPPTFSRPVFNGTSTDGAALGSQPSVCRFLRSPVPPVRPLAVAFRRRSRHCCGFWWNMIPCRFHCTGSLPEPGHRRPCSPL
jgi:hypothetical protein